MTVPRVLRTLALAGAVAIAPSCSREAPAYGQLLVYVATDAPVGPPGGTARPSIFDRLNVEVIAPGEVSPCAECTREFAVDDDRMARGATSFGVMPPVHTPGYRARLRLFRSGGTSSGEPRRGSTIERIVALPEVAEDGVVEVSVVLRVADLATLQGSLDAPLPVDPGRPPVDIVGSFASTLPETCRGDAREDEACVPGGVFWMGNPRLELVDVNEPDGRSERLVVVSPFFIDLAEVTVAQLRAAHVARPIDDPVEVTVALPGCVYTAEPGPYDALPVNCLTWRRARAYCEKVGKRLPTEAEYEFIAGALESRDFVWGADLPTCADAVFGYPTFCGGASRPSPAGTGKRDRIVLGGRTVVDLAGNLREYTADWFTNDTSCWGSGVFVDPLCKPHGLAEEAPIPRSMRGGSYEDDASLLRAAERAFVTDERLGTSEQIGFRCARSAR